MNRVHCRYETGWKYYIQCLDCENMTVRCSELESAEKAWNRRCTTPNNPLTLDELRRMDGEPIYVVHSKYGKGWCIIDWHGINKSWFYFSKTGTAEGMTAVPITALGYGVNWLAYRSRPDEVEK